MEFFDSHSHLADASFSSDVKQVLTRARDSGVTRIAVIADSVPEARDIIARFSSEDGCIGSVGVHPHYADTVTDDTLREIDELSVHPFVKAIGEIGLDTVRSKTTREDQLRAFRAQVQIARVHALPMVIHCREAFPDVFRILEEEHYAQGVLHCFTGAREDAMHALELGLKLSFSGILTYPQNQLLRDVAKELPESALMIETDSPYLPPEGKRGTRNEPVCVIAVAEVLAQVRGVSLETIAACTTETARALYRI